VITITDHKVGSFPDISLGQKIFSLARIFVLIADMDDQLFNLQLKLKH